MKLEEHTDLAHTPCTARRPAGETHRRTRILPHFTACRSEFSFESCVFPEFPMDFKRKGFQGDFTTAVAGGNRQHRPVGWTRNCPTATQLKVVASSPAQKLPVWLPGCSRTLFWCHCAGNFCGYHPCGTAYRSGAKLTHAIT